MSIDIPVVFPVHSERPETVDTVSLWKGGSILKQPGVTGWVGGSTFLGNSLTSHGLAGVSGIDLEACVP